MFRRRVALGGSVALVLCGCEMGPKMVLSARDREIKNATEVIETAANKAQRAVGFTKRGHAYSEKSRYSRVMKRIPAEEHEGWFAAAIADHSQAVALDSKSAEAYYMRGQAYLDRGGAELIYNTESKDGKPFFDLAAADFKKAIEIDNRNFLAWDRLGMVYMNTAEYDQAIDVFKQEMALNPMGKSRLADASCNRGSANHRAQNLDAAIADYERSIAVGANPDSCSCNPRLPLATLKKAQG